ncbi:tumor necrosis factor ligand superfamily member 14-like [Centroberyx gerrardi]|uniref:tumor necrosis factor ligand superfamily member 14-like n=1 Tax=Centroberyx gerrardi TaxID=166262 RepID=UPI003AAF28F7
MAEGNAGAYPQVFVVDSQASYAPLPSGKSLRWTRFGQRLLLLLVGLALLGVAVEGHFIYYLYNKTEPSSLCLSLSICQNHSKTSPQSGGNLLSRIGAKETNEIPPVPTRRAHPPRPSAHLMGSGSPVGEKNVVQWVHAVGDAFTYHMGYDKGHLLVEEEGYYYLYSKVYLNAVEECSYIKHKVMKDTKAYDNSMELMKSNRFHCRTPKASKDQRTSGGEDLWNSFLGGVFHLHPGDEIFVTLEEGRKMRQGTADNFMGAFMI